MIDEKKLQTIYNFALSKGATTSWIYRLIKLEKIKPTIVDGMCFIEYEKYLHIKKKRNKEVNKMK